jgi:hypothetical protein
MAKEAIRPMTVDKRVVERNIKKGLLSHEDYDKYLAALPDVADQSELVQARLGADAADDADDDDGEDSADAEG